MDSNLSFPTILSNPTCTPISCRAKASRCLSDKCLVTEVLNKTMLGSVSLKVTAFILPSELVEYLALPSEVVWVLAERSAIPCSITARWNLLKFPLNISPSAALAAFSWPLIWPSNSESIIDRREASFLTRSFHSFVPGSNLAPAY